MRFEFFAVPAVTLLFSVAMASDISLDSFCKKYGISSQELGKFERIYMESEFGLKYLTGLRAQLKAYTDREIDPQDLLQFAGDFSKKMDSYAGAKMTEFGGNFGLKNEDYDKALDDSLDDVDGKNPKGFLKGISKSLIKLAPKKLSADHAMGLAKAVQIRMDMKMMKNHLKDPDYMNRLLGENIEVFDRPMKEHSSFRGSVR